MQRRETALYLRLFLTDTTSDTPSLSNGVSTASLSKWEPPLQRNTPRIDMLNVKAHTPKQNHYQWRNHYVILCINTLSMVVQCTLHNLFVCLLHCIINMFNDDTEMWHTLPEIVNVFLMQRTKQPYAWSHSLVSKMLWLASKLWRGWWTQIVKRTCLNVECSIWSVSRSLFLCCFALWSSAWELNVCIWFY